MSDHYCCKTCGHRYDECTCPKAATTGASVVGATTGVTVAEVAEAVVDRFDKLVAMREEISALQYAKRQVDQDLSRNVTLHITRHRAIMVPEHIHIQYRQMIHTWLDGEIADKTSKFKVAVHEINT